MSAFLRRLNQNPIKEADHTYAFVCIRDEVLPAYTFGRLTHEWPTSDQSLIFDGPEFNHVGVRDLTGHIQYSLIQANSMEIETAAAESNVAEPQAFLAWALKYFNLH